VTVHALELGTVARIPVLDLAHGVVQPMPGGKILMVGARSVWREDGPDEGRHHKRLQQPPSDCTGLHVIEVTDHS